MLRTTFREIASAVAFLLLFALVFAALRPAAAAASDGPSVLVEATVDRIEDDLVVLDVPPEPSLPIARALVPWAREGDSLTLEFSVSLASGRIDADSVRVRVLDAGPPLRLAPIDAKPARIFRWPARFAPPVRAGDSLDVAIALQPRKNGRAAMLVP
jgi:hypothetical protein